MKKFEHLHITMVLSVEPDMNPDLGLPEKVATRRGITMCNPISHQPLPPMPATLDLLAEHMQLELQGGLRAMKHLLQENGYVEDDRPYRTVLRDGKYVREAR